MAMDYSNFELVQNIKRNLRGTSPKNKLSEIEDKLQVVIPVNSKAAPLEVRDTYDDQRSVPQNYLTIHAATTAAVTSASWTTMNIITVPSGYNYYFWGMYYGANIGVGKRIWCIWCSNATVDGNGDDGAYFGGDKASAAGCAGDQFFLTRPMFLPAGTTWYTRIYHDNGVDSGCTVKVLLEVRKIENRDA